jgi:DDE family transposase
VHHLIKRAIEERHTRHAAGYLLPFELPAVARKNKKVCIGFDGGMLSSDAGVLLLRRVEQRLSIPTRLAGCLTDHRDPNRIDHTLVEMLGCLRLRRATRIATTARRCATRHASLSRQYCPAPKSTDDRDQSAPIRLKFPEPFLGNTRYSRRR